MPDGLTPDIALGYVTSLLQALKPFSYFAWVAAGALLFWFLPVGRRAVGARGLHRARTGALRSAFRGASAGAGERRSNRSEEVIQARCLLTSPFPFLTSNLIRFSDF